MEEQPPLATDDGGPRRDSYDRLFGAFYRGAFEAGLQARILHPDQFADGDLPALLVATGYYTADDDLLDRLVAYARAGGHLLIGPRTGYADLEARARLDTQPARLAEAAGLWYDEFTNLTSPVEVDSTGSLDLPAQAFATAWAEGLTLKSAEPLAQYRHPFLGRWPAATTRTVGAGRITCVGTMPDPSFAKALFHWAYPAPAQWMFDNSAARMTSATAQSGESVRFLHNWSWQPAHIRLPRAVHDVLSDQELTVGDELTLGPWDVRVVKDV